MDDIIHALSSEAETAKMATVIWSPIALDDIDSIREFGDPIPKPKGDRLFYA